MTRSQSSPRLTSRAFAPFLLAGAMVLSSPGCAGARSGAEPPLPSAAPTLTRPLATLTIHLPRVPIRTAPSTEAPEAGFAGPGDRLEIVAHEGEWLLVELPDHVRGYVREALLFPLECTEDRPEPLIVQEPVMKFWKNGPRGAVTIEGTYDERGTLVGHEIVENSLTAVWAERALEDLKTFRFLPPTLDCEPRPFIYTFTRRF